MPRVRAAPLLAPPLLVVFAAALAPGASAQRPAPPDTARRDSARRDSVARLAPVEVVGSIFPTVGPAVGSAVPARVATVAAADVDRWEPRLLADALARQPGVSTYDDLGSPFKLTLQSRGFTSGPVVGLPQGISVFLDGVPVNEPDAAQVNFDLLPLEHVRRVELLSGTSSLLGPNSLGGAVNLVTRRGDGPPRGEVELSAGSYGLYSAEASAGGGARGWSYYAGAGYDADGGWRDVTGARLANGFANVGRLGPRAGVTLQLFAAGSYAETAGSLPLSVYRARPDSNLSAQDFEDLTQLHAAAAGYRPIGAGRLTFNAYHRRHGAERFNVNQPGDPDVRSFSRNRTTGATAEYQVARRALGAAAALRVGASGAANAVAVRILADRRKFGGGDSLTTSVQSPIARLGAYATGDLRYGPLTLSAGGRYDRVRVPFRNRLRPARDTTSVYARLSPKGGAALALGRRASVYASVGQSFRAPAVIELACADPREPCPLPFALGDDPPLAPVVATTAEVGARYAVGPLALDASAYRTGVRDDIFLFPYDEAEGEAEGSTVDGYFANVPRTRREGVELGSTLRLPRGASAFANYAYTRATFRTPGLAIFSIRGEAAGEGQEVVNAVGVGDRLPLVPAHALRAGLDVPLPRGFEAGVDVRHTGRQWLRGDEANETAPLAGYTVANLRIGYALGAWGAQAVAYNALGARYATFGTFNLNQGNANRLERFLTPGQPRVVRLVLRRAFGGGRDA